MSRGGGPGLTSLIVLMVSMDIKQHSEEEEKKSFVPIGISTSPRMSYVTSRQKGLGLDTALLRLFGRAQEPCESRGGRPGLPVSNSPYGL